MNRREALVGLSGMLGGLMASPAAAADQGPAQPNRLGLVTYCRRLLRKQLADRDPTRDLFEPFAFLDHCHKSGAGGMQCPLGILSDARCDKLRSLALERQLFVEAIISLPGDDLDLERFTAQMKTAARAGAAAVRTTLIPGRRYEFFDSLEAFRSLETAGRKSLERAAPVAEKLKLPLAVENHKDHRNDERIALLQHIGSEYVGACVDTGNSIALLEDPLETVTILAPWAHSVHLKDQAVKPDPAGFLLGDIPLGKGFLDLQRMVEILRHQKPDINFSLELITRDPLRVPCLEDEYWTTFPGVPAKDLARTLRQVRDHAAPTLQSVDRLPLDGQVALETANVTTSLAYARDHLSL